MACFIVPATEAVITTVAQKVIEAREVKAEIAAANSDAALTSELANRTAAFDAVANEAQIVDAAASVNASEASGGKIKFSKKLGWLNKMLWGGSILLAFEHIWHGELVLHAPFLTAVETGETAGMLQEMATSGVAMAVLVTAVWGVMLLVSGAVEKRSAATVESEEA